MNRKTVFAVLLGIAIFCCSGCGKQAFDRQRYALLVQRPDLPPPVKTQALLEVKPFSIDAAFASRSLTYRRTEHQFETDFYHEYLVGLNVMITDQTRRWFDNSGIFSAVFTSGSMLRPTHILEANIEAAWLDASQEGTPAARLQITFWLLQTETSNPTLMFGKSYGAEHPVDSAGTEAYMNAQRACLTDVLHSLENDLANVLKTQGFKNDSGTQK